MGADIHLFLERKAKIKGEDKWVGLKKVPGPADNRNYRLFADLAGVRGEGPEPKGLPDDVSDLVWMESDYWDVDAHSHSHCSLTEFIVAYVKHTCPEVVPDLAAEILQGEVTIRSQFASELFNVWDAFSDKDENPPAEYRLVFFFDN